MRARGYIPLIVSLCAVALVVAVIARFTIGAAPTAPTPVEAPILPVAQVAAVTLPVNSTTNYVCAGGQRIAFNRSGNSMGALTCSGPTVTPTRTPVATATRAATGTPPAATSTVIPSPTPPPPTATQPPPTATQVPVEATNTPIAATATPPPATPIAGQPCPASLHDSIKTAGPDGNQYPTWHPAVDPASGCFYGHEHGADPRTSVANNTMPAFGYANAVAGVSEPHAGFKVFVLNPGYEQEGGTAVNAFRIVFHHGTGGVGRYTTTFHSVQYDFVALDGSNRYAHVHGMMDTGPASLNGSTCSQPRKGAKDFATLGCADPYEIWNGAKFQLIHPDDPFLGVNETRWTVMLASALFDPITTRDPADNSRLIYTQQVFGPADGTDPASPAGSWQGCVREMYFGPVYSKNQGQPTIYFTDPYGRVQAGPGPNTIRQEVSATTNANNEIFKYSQSFCGNGIHAPN